MKQNLQEGIDFYYDEMGFMVLTATFHLKNGKCCGNGCKHCPFQYINVPEPRKSEILKNQKANIKSGS